MQQPSGMGQLTFPSRQARRLRNVARKRRNGRRMPRRPRIPNIKSPNQPRQDTPRKPGVLPSPLPRSYDQARHLGVSKDPCQYENRTTETDLGIYIGGSDRHKHRNAHRSQQAAEGSDLWNERTAVESPDEGRNNNSVEKKR
jgi:hypothetical protein